MIRVAVGTAGGTDSYKVGFEAVDVAINELGQEPNLCILFASVAFDQDKLVEAAGKRAGNAVLVGCSTAGEICSEGLSMSHSVVCMAIASDTMQFYPSSGEHLVTEPYAAGMKLAEKLQYDSHGYISTALLFLDVISGRGEEVFRGAVNQLGPKFPLFGGAAGDDLLFYQSFQYLGSRALSGAAVSVGISGNYHIGYGEAHGFLPVGIGRRVTKTEGTHLIELDGKPAAQIYLDYFGDEHMVDLREELLSSLAVSYPLGVSIPGKEGFIIRNPIYADRWGGMTFTSEIPLDAEVRLMISGKDEAIASAKEATLRALEDAGDARPKGVIIINSIARKKLLGSYADDEIRVIQQLVGRDVPIVGFYSYAQLGSNDNLAEIPFHNSAIVVLVLTE